MADIPDLDRVGLFSDPGFISTKEKYRIAADTIKDSSRGKGRQMQTGSATKTFDASQDGYFGKEFIRMFVGEGYADTVRLRRQERNRSAALNLDKKWVPSAQVKMPCGLGSFCPCIDSSPPVAFTSPFMKLEKEPFKGVFHTKPPRKGSGYGYLDVTMHKYPEYMSDSYVNYRLLHKQEAEDHRKRVEEVAIETFHCGRYGEEYFTKNPHRQDRPQAARKPKKLTPPVVLGGPFITPATPKLQGGSHAGTFNPYPEHSDEPFRALSNKDDKIVKPFLLGVSVSSRPSPSILYQNVEKELNSANFKTLETVMKY